MNDKKKRTFLGNLWRSIVKNNIPLGETLVDVIDGGNPSEIIEAITIDKKLSDTDKQYLLDSIKLDQKETEMFLNDMSNARDMYKNSNNEVSDFIAKRVINYNLWVVFLAIVTEVLAVMYMDDKILVAVISGAIGSLATALLQERQQVINFFFGSSMGSKEKDKKKR